MVSIIIPAHNEANSIAGCLKYLTNNGNEETFQIIVVCNGCTDSTANVVREFSNKITCLETDVASKTNALNLGDAEATFFPRVYLDADIKLSSDAVLAMCSALKEQSLATSVAVKMNMQGCSWIVKAFYDIWLNLSYCSEDMVGGGLYALSQQGRERFGQFPEIINDDGYVLLLFAENERSVTRGVYSEVRAPKDFASLIKIRTRVRLGQYELRDKFAELFVNELKDRQWAFKSFLFDYRVWPKLVIYLGIDLVSRLRANFQYYTRQSKWERDESSRS